jgi:hypothetical protein
MCVRSEDLLLLLLLLRNAQGYKAAGQYQIALANIQVGD